MFLFHNPQSIKLLTGNKKVLTLNLTKLYTMMFESKHQAVRIIYFFHKKISYFKNDQKLT